MKLRGFRNIRRILQAPPALAAAAALAIVLAWAAWSYATIEEMTIHVFPSAVEADGWENAPAALMQDLSANAVLLDFSEENSAHLYLERETDADAGAPAQPSDSSEGDPVRSVGDTESQAPEASPTEGEPAPTDAADSAPAKTDAASAIETESGGESESPASAESQPPSLDAPAEAAAPSAARIPWYIEHAFAAMFALPAAHAQTTTSTGATTTESVPAAEAAAAEGAPIPPAPALKQPAAREADDDVTVCSVRNAPCRLLEFSGFSIGNALADADLASLQLRLSMGWRMPPGAIEDDKVFVRYFFDGRWHLAGEVAIVAGEMGNAQNGGHFLFALPESSDWDMLDTLRVQVEYVRENDSSAEIYLDGLWVDASYHGAEAELEAENILAELAALEESRKPDVIVTPEGGEASFLFDASEPGAPIAVRLQESVARGLTGTEVLISLTNLTPRSETVALTLAMQDGVRIDRVAQYVPAMVVAAPEAERSSVAYFCESGWASTTDLGLFACTDTGESQPCDAVNDDATNCITHDAAISVAERTAYKPGWMPLATTNGIGRPRSGIIGAITEWFGSAPELSEIPETHTVTMHANDLRIAPGATVYLAATLAFPPGENGAVYLTAEGDKGASVRAPLWWESAWRYRAAVENAPEPSSAFPRYLSVDALGETGRALFANAQATGNDLRVARVSGSHDWAAAGAPFRMRVSAPLGTSSVDAIVDLSPLGASFFTRMNPRGEGLSLYTLAGERVPAALRSFNRRERQAAIAVPAEYRARFSEGAYLYFGGSSEVRFEPAAVADAVPAVAGAFERYAPPVVTELNAWIQRFDHARGAAGIWFRDEPTAAGTSTLYLYFGNPNAGAVGGPFAPFATDAPIVRASIEGAPGGLVWMGSRNPARVSLGSELHELAAGASAILPAVPEGSLRATQPVAVAPADGRAPRIIPASLSPLAASSSEVSALQALGLSDADAALLASAAPAEWGTRFLVPPLATALSVRCTSEARVTVRTATTTQAESLCTGSSTVLQAPAGAAFPSGAELVASAPVIAAVTIAGAQEERVVPLWSPAMLRGAFALTELSTLGLVEELSFAPLALDGAVDPTAKELRYFKRHLADPRFHTLRSETRDFMAGDDLSFALSYRSQRNAFVRWFRDALYDRPMEVAAVRFFRDGGAIDIPYEIAYAEGGEWTLNVMRDPRAFMPGKYRVEIVTAEGAVGTTDSFEFYWGVLAVNTDKSVYAPGETALFSMAALDDGGSTICDAILKLSVTSPSGAVSDVPVERAPECGPNNVIEVPDYFGRYALGEPGTYTVMLTHFNHEGEAVHIIEDSFQAVEKPSFSVTRTGPTRIYPKAPYTMRLDVVANVDFTGTLRELLPEGFIIDEAGEGRIGSFGDGYSVEWDLSLRAGERASLSYRFDAPDRSPYVYVLGPASFTEAGGNTVFEETRTWKIASDALGQYIEKAVSWSATSANVWQTKDLSASPFNVPANAVVEIAIYNSDNGAERNAGIRAASSSLSRIFDLQEAEPQGVTAVTMHTQVSATSTLQHFAEDITDVTYVLVGYWTSGVYVDTFTAFDPPSSGAWGSVNLSASGLGDGEVGEFVIENVDAAVDVSAGVRRLSSSNDRRVTIHEPESGGITPVSMLAVASTSNATVQAYSGTTADTRHVLVGYWAANPEGLLYTERFDTLTGPSSNSTWTDAPLDSYGVPPEGIAEVLFSNIADANNSILLGARSDGSTLDRSLNLHEAEGGGAGETLGRLHVTAADTASSTIELYTDSTTEDAFRLLGYWGADDYPAETPTLYDIPFDNEKLGTSSPIFEFESDDPDGTSDLVYQIQWDDDANLDDAPIGDRSSDNETGCSPNCFENLDTPADTSPFAEAERVRFTIRSGVTSNTTYYWRVRATDVAGSNIPSEWSDVRSFTYVSGQSPSSWFQTEDEQFETGSLTTAETTGLDSVEISTTPPTGAILVYGESTTQTPRYRLWDTNSNSWGSEDPHGAAQSVGGTIRWVIAKPAPTRDEYIVGTLDANSDVNFQIYNATATAWGNLTEITDSVSDNTRRGFDVAYESLSGDAVAVACDGDADPRYAVWNGSSWSATSSINLNSANNCGWIKLASNPVSDEIVLVSLDSTGSQYEAFVWNGSSWGSSQILGSQSEPGHEGIAVEYEESGGQAVVAVSNGGANNNYAWTAWDGNDWSPPATQALGDDLDWAYMARDNGTDQLGFCYMDDDRDLGFRVWDGDGWLTFAELATDANNNGLVATAADGRPISCEFETTSARDGYLMIPYTDETNARYRYYTGTTTIAEATLSSIQDSWAVGTARTGEGKILAVFFDDQNGRYDASSWDGTSWSAGATIENSPSVTATPFNEPISVAAQRYQESSGTALSDPIDFDYVSGQPTWGEALWNTTEPASTDVLVRVRYATSSAACTELVSDSDLPGNAAGFDASQSPLDLSGLSTSTYPQLCLEATMTSTGESSPTLDDWTVSWQRQPYLTQEAFRFYVSSSSSTPTDAWPTGATADLGENEPIPAAYAPKPGDSIRLRMAVKNQNVAVATSTRAFRLEYAETASCSADATVWLPVGAVGSTTAKWRGADLSGLSDGSQIAATVIATSTVRQTYEEANDSVSNPAGLPIGAIGEWEWVLNHNASSSESYCFRMVNTDGTALNAYTQYPSLLTNDAPDASILDKLFDNEMVGTTTPSFEFVSSDPQNDDVMYEVEIDDDFAFGSVNVSRNSQANTNDFSNIVRPADKNPFTAGETVRFTVPSALTNNTTYWWRVRAKDPSGSNEWSEWSGVQSFTVDTSVTITTWHQTTQEQFDTNDLLNTETSASDDVILSAGQTLGTTTGPAIDFDWKTTGNSWGTLAWSENETTGDIRYKIEYQTAGGAWAPIPDTDLSGNAAGFGGSSVSLLSLDPSTYNVIRPVARFTDIGGSPRLLSWTVSWGLAVEQPTVTAPFDNEKIPTRTPTFEFISDDPQDNDLVYEISWATTTEFTSSTTRNSASHAGFANAVTATDTSPFIPNQTVQFTVQSGDILASSTTYWWRVRARDPSGGDAWSVWSTARSITVDTTVAVSTWFQTTDEQWETDTLTDLQTDTGSVEITTIIREAMMAYGEGTALSPKYRLWNGSTSTAESSASSIADRTYWLELAAAPTRDEYAMITMGSSGEVRAQIFNGSSDTWGNQATVVYTTANILRRGIDIAYETSSGDALAVACSGADALYRVWNGTSWSATSTINLSSANNCEWIRLASDPASDEIILLTRDTVASAPYDYEALVWNGSSWGNSLRLGAMTEAADEGMAVAYEESGNQAIVVVSDGDNPNFDWASWNGSSWSATSSVTMQDDFEGGELVADLGSDELALCYVDNDSLMGFVEWSGSGWGSFNQMTTGSLANSKTETPVTCQYETTAGRDGNVMLPYSNQTVAAYQFWNGAFSGEVAISTITDSAHVKSARTGDGNILTLWYDDTNTEYDFSYWDGSSWSAEAVLEQTSINNTTPRTNPFDIVSRRYPSFTEGTIAGTAIDFDDGNGPKWQSFSFSDTRPGSSVIRYQLEYQTATGSWAVIPDTDLPGNETGTTTGPVNLGNLNFINYNVIRPVAELECVSGQCPLVNDWTITWSEGITVSGSAKAYDQSTNLTSGTVAIAVNGVLQAGKTGTISAGAWSIPNVTIFQGDTLTAWIDGAATATRAVAVTAYDGIGDITGIELISRHLSLGSPSDAATTTNARIALYDNSVSADNDIFFDVSAGNDLTVCAVTGCEDAELYIVASSTFTPSTSTAETVNTHDIEINGTLQARTSTLNVSGSWDNDGIFSADTSSVVFTSASTTETIDSTGATTSAFYSLTLGQTFGTSTFNLLSDLDVDNNLTVAYGTLGQNGGYDVTVAGNLAFQTGGRFARGTGTTTFDGSGSTVWSDSSSPKQNLGNVVIDGSTKTVTLGSAVKAHSITIGADDTLAVSGNHYAIEVTGSFDNNNVFTAGQGTLTLSGTTSGLTVEAGSSAFYNLTFSGTSGIWSFPLGAVSVTNDMTIATGTVTLPNGTTTVGGSFLTTGAFQHNNGTVLFNATAAGKSIRASSSPFFNLAFNGSGGAWSFLDTAATTSNDFRIQNGTVSAPASMLAIGGSFDLSGGSFSPGSGRTRFYSSAVETVNPGGSTFASLAFEGATGAWSFITANATATGDVVFTGGTTTLPSGTLAVGGSFNATSSFAHNSGTVRLYGSVSNFTVASLSSPFSAVRVHAPGSYRIATNATTTGLFELAQAGSFALANETSLAIGGRFSNLVGGASTTFTGSTLHLYSGTAFAINAKSSGSDTYGRVSIGQNTDVSMWNSSAASYSVDPSGSLYSQDHAAVDGDLSIWGEYLRTSGADYWSYATDFDGVALGGSSRQVDVRLAPSSSATFASGATLAMVGAAGASTTVDAQSGFYSLALASSTINAQYYSIARTATSGLAIVGSSTVTSLQNGTFTLGYEGAAALSVAGHTITNTPELQIFGVSFATSAGISTGSNVAASGTPQSYWWFRESYGNFDGEAFDADPNGDPGAIRWDDSGYTISVSGRVFQDDGTTVSPACDGVATVVRLVVDAGTSYDAACAAGTGVYTFPAVSFSGDADLIAYLNTGGGRRGATVSRTPTVNIANFHIYENRTIVRHEDTDPVGISHMATYDADLDPDIPFNAATGTVALTTSPGTGLYIWNGKTFTPGGNVTLQSGGVGAEDGTLHLATSSAFVSSGSQSHAIGGSFFMDSGSAYTPASAILTFTATTSGKYIAASTTVYRATWNGAGGGWNLARPLIASNAASMAAGTLAGTSTLLISQGGFSGAGTVAMTGGRIELVEGGNLGGAADWTFANLSLTGGSGSTTKSGAGDVTVSGAVTISSSHTLNAGSVEWNFTSGGSPLVIGGTFNADTSTTTFSAASAATIPGAAYYRLNLAPSAAGGPTFTFNSTPVTVQTDFLIGSGAFPVTVNANASDPIITVSGDVAIAAGATYSASNLNDLSIGGSFDNDGTFTSNSGGVLFNSADTGETVEPGGSSFHNVSFNNAGGGWTLSQSATATGNFTLTNASAFTLSSGASLAVGGVFTNLIGGGNTTWAGTTLRLYSGTNYTLNTKAAGADTYATLLVDANTDIRMWNSSASTYAVDASGSLYSQDHAAIDGSLSIWGDYVRSTGADYWSYATDFDGTALGGGSRAVNVSLAPSATTTLSGGSLEIRGSTSTATTSVAAMASGTTYAIRVTGGTLDAKFYRFRDLNQDGLFISGAPVINELGYGDYELSVAGGSMITAAGATLNANPLKVFRSTSFATSSGIASGYNVTVTGGSVSSWRFADAYGNYDGESFDNDPGGDPGNVVWDDSAADIEVSGAVYSDEGQSVSPVCDDATPAVTLLVAGGSAQSVPCASADGAYTVGNIFYTEGDSIIVYLNTNGGRRAATVTADPVSTITDMDLYENRVIVRHEDASPVSIDDLDDYDSDQDGDIPFDAEDAAADTLTVVPNVGLYVWENKSFDPLGTITLQSGGSGQAFDGSLYVATSSSVAARGFSFSIGGSMIGYQGGTFVAATSSVAFTATTAGKSIALDSPSFNNLSFTGAGGAWAFNGTHATATGDVAVSAGTVSFPATALAVGGSFDALGGTFAAGTSTLRFTSTAPGETVRFAGSAPHHLRFAGAGGTFAMQDTNATTTGTVAIDAGTVALPSGTLAIAGSFTNAGAFTHAGTLRFMSATSSQTLLFGGSAARNLVFDGAGSWVFTDTNATTTGTTTVLSGGLTAPSGVFSIGASFSNAATFNANAGTLRFFGSSSAVSITPGGSTLSAVDIDGSAGSFTLTQSATTSNAFTLRSARNFTLQSAASLGVNGTFTNLVGGASTTWSNTTLFLNSGTNYTLNTKTAGGDQYQRLTIASSTDVRMWNSAATSTDVHPTGSLYSQDHAAVDGDLYLFGEYIRSTGADYWSYANDFDGTALGGSSRQVDVRIASSSSVTLSGGSLAVTGALGASTTIANQGAGTYAFSVAGGTFSASYYGIQHVNASGLSFSGAPAISDLANGDLTLFVNQGTIMTVAASVIDANPTLSFAGMRFASSTGVATGTNVTRTGTTTNTWTFTGTGALYGEQFDIDGTDHCGAIRFSNSTCLEVSQLHYRFRADDGGEGAPDSEWYDGNWSKRKRITIVSPTSTDLSDQPVMLHIAYDSDMQSDFDDLRFTQEDGTTTIAHWFETYSASATATVWVAVPTVPADATTYIYMYYGNPSAAGAGDAESVFTAADDFEDDDIAEYSGDSSLFDTAATYAYQGGFGLGASPGNSESQTTDGIYRTSLTVSQGSRITFYQYVDASKDDEPCALFAVQSPGSNNQNYAVCLDQFPAEQVSIAENVSSNDESGTILDSESVTYSTGWHRVEIDWGAGTIAARVYDPSGSLIASPSASDSSYTSGGFGFTFWYQAGGWDAFFARPLMANEPYGIAATEQVDGGASWRTDQDDALIGQGPDEPFRLRVGIVNSGPPIVDQNFRLQYASKTGYGSCEAVPSVTYNDVPVSSGCGASPICMAASGNVVNQEVTTQHLMPSLVATFTPGYLVEDTANQTNDINVGQSYFTEAEYVIAMTTFADQSSYCLRVTDGGLELDTYPRVPEVTLEHVPTISNWRLNLDEPISLTEGATTSVVATATVTDLNGYADITQGTSTLYRSAVGASCTDDPNNCYQLSAAQCPLSDCADSSCTITCTAPVQYFAEPTDAGSTFALQEWRSYLSVVDSTGNYATATALGVELMTLWAIDLASSSIDYGTLSVGDDTGAYNATTTVENTGNAPIDIDLSGSDLTGSGASTISVANQKFSTSSFNYAACAICQFLSGTSTTYEVDLPKATATTSPSLDNLFWGIYVPLGTGGVAHFGTTTFIPIGD